MSLAFRLVASVVTVQAAAVVAWMALLMTVSPYVSYEELAAGSALARVEGSLRRSGGGGLEVRPSPALRAYAARRPGFAYAVLDRDRPVFASDPRLQAMVDLEAGWLPSAGVLRLRDGGQAHVSARRIGGGLVTIVTTGNRFGAEDAPAFFTSYLPQFLLMFGPAVLAAAVVMPWAVRRALQPLKAAAAEAATMSADRVGAGLSRTGLPEEVKPFADAIDRLLGRVGESMASQRLFLANAAHEVRTPVAILNARIDSLPPGASRNELQRDVRRLTTLIDQLLASARVRDGQVTRTSLDLAQLVREVAADLAPLALRSGRGLELDVTIPVAEVEGDRDALRSVVTNLVENALRAEPEGGGVSIRVREGPVEVVLDVEDHGCGVADADRLRIFEPFWRGAPNGQGAGLGLAIVQSVAEWHGGLVSLAETRGGGATFSLRLPKPQAPTG